eukprot:jgi/Tetstr1/454524/TSEL_041421.t1
MGRPKGNLVLCPPSQHGKPHTRLFDLENIQVAGRSEAVGKYWWVHPKDTGPGYNIPFRTAKTPDAERLTTIPSIERMDLYFDGTVGRREEPLVHIARVHHARDPTKLRRYNALHRTTKDRPASRVAARPAEAGLKVTGRKAEQQLRTQEEMMAGRAAAEAVAAAKKELQRKLEEMAVDDLLAGRMQLVNRPGTGVVARQALLPRLSKSPLWDKRQRSPVRSAAISPVRPLRPKEEVETMKAQQSAEFSLGGKQHCTQSLSSSGSSLFTERGSAGSISWTPRVRQHSAREAYVLRYSAPEGYVESAISMYERQTGKRLSSRRPATSVPHSRYKAVPIMEDIRTPGSPQAGAVHNAFAQPLSTSHGRGPRSPRTSRSPGTPMANAPSINNGTNSFINTMVVRPTSAAVGYQQIAAGVATAARAKQQAM